jgi:tetratricopeptide (TPR) repeat protein
MVKIQLD